VVVGVIDHATTTRRQGRRPTRRRAAAAQAVSRRRYLPSPAQTVRVAANSLNDVAWP
jgi:hypothetical protein